MHSKIEVIVSELNKHLQSKLQPIFNVGTMLFSGIVKPIYKGNEIINTVEVQSDTNLQNVVFQDRHKLQVYHKIINPLRLYRDIASPQNQMRGQARILAVIYTSYDRLALLEAFVSNLPTILKVDGFSTITIATSEINTNEPQIFANERGNIEYDLNKTWQLATVEYTLNYAYNEKC